MEKAVLKTLIYANLFDYPLTIFEIHKWLIGKKANLRQVESALGRLVKSAKLKVQSGYFLLPKRQGLVSKKLRKEKQSAKYFKKAQIVAQILKLIPTIKLIGISGGLAMGNASKEDDIDLFVITGKNRLWISRLLILGLLSLTGQRREAGHSKRQAGGKLCLNTILEEDFLEQSSKDIYVAHEVLQMKVLWQRDGVYSRYLLANEWTFKFLPNWTASNPSSSRSVEDCHALLRSLAMTIEQIAKWWQLKIMQKPQGLERIEDGALYFHPNDYRANVLKEYKLQLKKLY